MSRSTTMVPSAAGEAESVGGLSLGSGSVVAARPTVGVSSNIAKNQPTKHSVARCTAALKRRSNVLIPSMSSYNDHLFVACFWQTVCMVVNPCPKATANIAVEKSTKKSGNWSNLR